MQDCEGLWPKRNLAPVEKEAAAMQIQNIAIEPQPLWLGLSRRAGITIGHPEPSIRYWQGTHRGIPAAEVRMAATYPDVDIL
jgi:hypothetical protein